MDFFEDIDEDFGEKLSVGEIIKMLEKSTVSKKRKKHSNQTKVIVFEDEIDEDEYFYYDAKIDSLSNQDDLDFAGSISREICELTQNGMLNEPLEEHYACNVLKKPTKAETLPVSRIVKVPETDENRPKKIKSKLKKTAIADDKSNCNVTSRKKNVNALVQSLQKQEESNRVNSSDKPKKTNRVKSKKLNCQ
ncbi:hypothetical protein U1Q18_050852 [Sarracenia purpurea var. burkii]